jgi:hypothetical protein
MKSLRIALLLCAVLVMNVHFSAAQDLSGQLGKLVGKNAVNYVKPIVQGWGAGLNSGFYHSADLHDILGFDVQLKLSSALLSDEDKTYDFEMPDQITYNAFTLRAGTDYEKFVRASTAVGSKDETIVRTKSTSIVPNQVIARLPGGYNLPISSLIVPQAAIGLPFGLEVMGRFVPTMTISSEGTDIGKVNFLGFGVRHDIDQYIPAPLPIDIAVHFMTQKFNFKDASDNNLISANAMAYGLEASAKAFIFTLYGGFQLESSKFTIGPYTATFQEGTQTRTVRVDEFEIEGKNKSRFHAGLRLILLIVNVHADYSFAETPVITVGAGITLR